MPAEYTKQDRIAVITLNRPEALNAFDPALLESFSAALRQFSADAGAWVAIITGEGSAFSVGADVAATLPLLKQGQAGPPTIMRGLEIGKPLIAAVNGAALGGGLELALSCDLRLAADNAVFGFPEAGLGLIPGWGGTQRIIRAMPTAIAAELLLTGRPISSARALQAGLVSRVVPRAELMDAARLMAQAVCRVAPLAARAAKQAMLEGGDLPLKRGLELERSLNDRLVRTEDFDEGCRAFQEKRRPLFKER